MTEQVAMTKQVAMAVGVCDDETSGNGGRSLR